MDSTTDLSWLNSTVRDSVEDATRSLKVASPMNKEVVGPGELSTRKQLPTLLMSYFERQARGAVFAPDELAINQRASRDHVTFVVEVPGEQLTVDNQPASRDRSVRLNSLHHKNGLTFPLGSGVKCVTHSPNVGARQRIGAQPRRFRADRGVRLGGDCDGEAEFFKLGDETSGLALRVVAAPEVVIA